MIAMTGRVDRILKALRGKPDILWGVYKGLHDVSLLSPWEWDGGRATRKQVDDTAMAVAWKANGWCFEVATVQGSVDTVSGRADSLTKAMYLADLALKEAGWTYLGDTPKVAAPWVQIHSHEWRRLRDGDTDTERVAEVFLAVNNQGNPDFTGYARRGRIPGNFKGFPEAREAVDAILEKEGWWLL